MPEPRVAGKGGRRSPSHEPSLRLSNFAPSPSSPSPQGDVSGGIADRGILGNDSHNDCGAAALQHGRMAKSGRNVVATPRASRTPRRSQTSWHATTVGINRLMPTSA